MPADAPVDHGPLPPPAPYAGPRHAWRIDLVARALESAAPPGLVVDAGCGWGTLAVRLAQGGRAVVAFDLDPRRLAGARRAASATGVAARIVWVRADAAYMPVADGAAAAMALGEVLEHLADDGAAAREAARALAPNGVLVATVPAGPGRFGPGDAAAGHARRYDRPALLRLAAHAGLAVETARGWGFPFGRLYDRWVQRPALATRGAAARRRLARLGRWRWLAGPWRLAFSIDEVVPQGCHGSGWLLVARKRRDQGV